jgi:Ca2+-binding EF-hand superfamily protein
MTLVLGAAAVPSLARPSPRAEFDRLDRNGDARLSLAELSDRTAVEVDVRVKPGLATSLERAADQARVRTLVLRTVFDRLDADRDGEVTFDEYLRAAGRTTVTRTGTGALA